MHNLVLKNKGFLGDALYIYTDAGEVSCACAKKHALDGRDVGVIPAPTDGKMLGCGHLVIGGIEAEPARQGIIDGKPGMGGICPHEFFLARGRQGLEITAHIPGGKTQAAQAGDGHMGEVLADALSVGKDPGKGGGDSSKTGMIGKILVDAGSKIQGSKENRSFWGKRSHGVLARFRAPCHEGGIQSEWAGFKMRIIFPCQARCFFPGKAFLCSQQIIYPDHALGGHQKPGMRFFYREMAYRVPEEILAIACKRHGRLDHKGMRHQGLMRHQAGTQPSFIVGQGYGGAVIVFGVMPHPENGHDSGINQAALGREPQNSAR